jgi:ElaB/YqjD/DUF883 family membrane-anchored ribosome-binding protein
MNEFRAGPMDPQERDAGISEVVSDQATKAKETGRRELRAQLDERSTQVGRQARSLAEVLRRSGDSLQSEGVDEGVERITSGVAVRLERAGGYLERARGDEMLRDAERFVRSRPWLVTGAAAAAGLVASRLFKASSEDRYERASTSPSYPRGAGAARPQSDAELVGYANRETAGTAY